MRLYQAGGHQTQRREGGQDKKGITLQLFERLGLSSRHVIQVSGGESSRAKEVEQWVRDISDLHRAKPPPSVQYHNTQPELETLLAEWPQQLESLLATNPVTLPHSQLDLETYIDIRDWSNVRTVIESLIID